MIEDDARSDVFWCDAPRCRNGPLPLAAFHRTTKGDFCATCCPRFGSIGCSECWEDPYADD
jgi:hypothetical protein